jgi:deoxyribodipyrimidine photolyase-related protein
MQLRLVMGDQLNCAISSLDGVDKTQDIIMLCEVLEEASYVQHHQKKLVYVFSAMRHFAQTLQSVGFTVHYVKLDDANNTGTFSTELARAVRQFKPQKVVVTEPSEYRVMQAVKTWSSQLNLAVDVLPDKRFLCSHKGFTQWASGRKQWRMEYFYREIRKTYGILMAGDSPIGGSWNYDAQNRKPPSADIVVPRTYMCAPDAITREVMDMVEKRFSSHVGTVDGFSYAVTRLQALEALNQFIATRLPLFGDYQDAMVQNEPWMFHSHISLYLNSGLLLPLECISAAEQAYGAGLAPLNATEGFIRQIAGWREFVRGVYWLCMPTYQEANALEAHRPLPDLYWSANTHMNCLKQCVSETLQNAYAHHIQRLMVLGNFALLTGLHPKAVNEWYLLVYADAYEWVEMPNVTGMVLFADGGKLASKPYAASGAYIHKMSNYCANCHYNVKQKEGELACPFNYLYWGFLMKNQATLQTNGRLGLVLSALNQMPDATKQQMQTQTDAFLQKMDAGEKV